ncbi:hypothetical protein AB0F91_05250 [Amycolatopsis sp. NPDC023774]|uniref:hypothetical protein n=1 Tax=Amycolatopsis sp. NPDC023774 TaxID=3155015 RepID=UPI0034088BC8
MSISSASGIRFSPFIRSTEAPHSVLSGPDTSAMEQLVLAAQLLDAVINSRFTRYVERTDKNRADADAVER